MTKDAERFGQTVAAQLRAEAAAKKIPVTQLAKRAHINRETLDRWLKGDRALSVPTLYKIAQVLNIDPHVIVRRAEERFEAELEPREDNVVDFPKPTEERRVAFTSEIDHSNDTDDLY